MLWCGGSRMPCTSTARPGRADHASSAVCRLTCSNSRQLAADHGVVRAAGAEEAGDEGGGLVALALIGRLVHPLDEPAEGRRELACLRLWRVVRHTLLS